jgi:hypothetical protein
MAETLVAADLDLALDVLSDVAAEVALDLVVRIDELTDPQYLGIAEVPNLCVVVDIECLKYVEGPRASDPEDIRETNLNTFVPWEIDSGDSCHALLPLTLLVARVLADHPNAAMSPDDPTLLAHLLR